MQARLSTPFGHIVLEERDGKAVRIDLRERSAETAIPPKFPRRVLEPLRAYFDGRVALPKVPLAAEGTVFQRAVWESLPEIPAGFTLTYGELGRRIGHPGAARAVGQALRNNPLPIVWPCHRVVGSTGLGGFGGASREDDPRERAMLDIKRWLLDHEARIAGVPRQQTLLGEA